MITELINKIESDSQIESRLTALGWGMVGREIEQKEKELIDTDNIVVMERSGVNRSSRGCKGIYGNRKKTKKTIKK